MAWNERRAVFSWHESSGVGPACFAREPDGVAFTNDHQLGQKAEHGRSGWRQCQDRNLSHDWEDVGVLEASAPWQGVWTQSSSRSVSRRRDLVRSPRKPKVSGSRVINVSRPQRGHAADAQG